MLCQILAIDRVLLGPDVTKEAGHFIEHGECGLAYDVLIFAMQDGTYHPSNKGLALIKHVARVLGVVVPKLGTD